MPQRIWRAVKTSPDGWLLALLVAVALAPRLALQFQSPDFGHPDSPAYMGAAYDLATGQGLTNSLVRPIAYTGFLAGSIAIFGPNLMAVTALQHGLGVVTVALTYVLGRVCFSRWVGIGAGVMVAVSGPQLALEHTTLAEPLFFLLLVALALALVQVKRTTDYQPALLAGLLLGLATLTKPIGQGLFPLALAFALFRPGTPSQRLLSAGVLAGIFGLLVIPWMYWNLVSHGQFTVGGTLGSNLVSRTVNFSRGKFLFDGAGLPAETDAGRSTARRLLQTGVERRLHEVQVLESVRDVLHLSDAEADLLVQQVIIDTIKRQPLEFIGDIPKFVSRLYTSPSGSLGSPWLPGEYLRHDHRMATLVNLPTPERLSSMDRIKVLLTLYEPWRLGIALPAVGALGLVAACRLRPLSAAVVPGTLAIFLVVLQVAVNGPQTRYRYAVEPFVDVLACGAVWISLRYACRGAGVLMTHIVRARLVK